MTHTPQKTYYTYIGPFGVFSIAGEGDAVTAVTFGDFEALPDFARDDAMLHPSIATNDCANQLLQYFAGKRQVFDVKMQMDATDFRRDVWEAILGVAYGETATATQIARDIGRSSAHRAVGQACNECPLAVIVPTHRIIPADGYIARTDSAAKIAIGLRNLEASYMKKSGWRR
jgi:methylated-DNA-[protein]-cysteine S-methyltransferase